MPGVWDALSAQLAAEAGFDTVFLSGYCVSGTLLGLPDFGYLTQTEMAEVARRVCRGGARRRWSSSTPTPATATRSTPSARSSCGRRPARPGIFLEDQVWPKRCGHMAGKQVVPTRRVAGASCAPPCDHRDQLHVTARTDARAAVGLDEAHRAGTHGARRRASTRCSSRRPSRSPSSRRSPRRCRTSRSSPTWSRPARRRCSRRPSWPTSASR